MISVNDIRDLWFSFFSEQNYNIVDSSSLIPEDGDKSLLWVNSGIAALKKIFFVDHSKSINLVNCQRVIRFEDLPDIEADKFCHLTLFEMLGVFSVNSNFKKETISLIWKFFTSDKWLGLGVENLFVTVWSEDHISINCWKNIIGLDEKRIIFGDKKTNFWDMGDGPCGSNTEIYYDFDPNAPFPLKSSDLSDGRFIEICNMVFPDLYHRGNIYSKMNKSCVDVGAGLERIAMVIQKKRNVFEIDIWSPIIKLMSEIYFSISNKDINHKDERKKNSFYIIADHLRTIIFALADGAKFSSKGAGYTLKKLIKTVAIESYFLNFNEIDLRKIIHKLFELNYIALRRPSNLDSVIISLSDLIENEFRRHFNLIKKYESDLDNFFDRSINNISAKDIFFLYDTKGIPLRLIRKYFLARNVSFPDSDFNFLLKDQKMRSLEDRKSKDINVF